LSKPEDLKHLCSGAAEDFDRYMGIAFTVYAVSEAVLTIWRAASPLELGRLLSGPQRQLRRLGLNFSAFGEEDKRARKGAEDHRISHFGRNIERGSDV